MRDPIDIDNTSVMLILQTYEARLLSRATAFNAALVQLLPIHSEALAHLFATVRSSSVLNLRLKYVSGCGASSGRASARAGARSRRAGSLVLLRREARRSFRNAGSWRHRTFSLGGRRWTSGPPRTSVSHGERRSRRCGAGSSASSLDLRKRSRRVNGTRQYELRQTSSSRSPPHCAFCQMKKGKKNVQCPRVIFGGERRVSSSPSRAGRWSEGKRDPDRRCENRTGKS